MRQIFEEFGKIIIAVVASVLVLSLLFSSFNILGEISSSLEVDTNISNVQGEHALHTVLTRAKPIGDFEDVNLHLYKNAAFRPLDGVGFTDADGNVVNAKVISILFYDSEGHKTELIDCYNSEENAIILNPEHYSNSHLECNVSEFAANGDGDLIITDDDSHNCFGVAVVTFAATDRENQVTIEQLTFVVDNKMK